MHIHIHIHIIVHWSGLPGAMNCNIPTAIISPAANNLTKLNAVVSVALNFAL